MKGTRDHSDAIALGASVLIHGVILLLCVEIAPPLPEAPAVAAPRTTIASRVYVDDSPTRPEPVVQLSMPRPRSMPQPPAPEEPPAPAPFESKPVIPPGLAPQDPLIIRPNAFGELMGADDASAIHSLSGDKPMEAPKGDQDQPYISRDPGGTHRLPDQPAKSDEGKAEKPGKPGDSGAVREARPEVPPPPLAPVPIAAQPAVPPGATNADLPGPHATLTTRPSQPELLAMAQPPNAPPPRPQAAATKAESGDAAGQTGTVGSPDSRTSPSSSADPAPMTDSESDPFSVHGAAVFRPGRVSAMFGRKVMAVRPRLSLAAQYDLLSLPSPDVILRVRADETGKVLDVAVEKSSGSRDVDQPCKLAMYDWWFEPPRDTKGRPKACEMLWTIAFRVR